MWFTASLPLRHEGPHSFIDLIVPQRGQILTDFVARDIPGNRAARLGADPSNARTKTAQRLFSPIPPCPPFAQPCHPIIVAPALPPAAMGAFERKRMLGTSAISSHTAVHQDE